MQRKSSSYLPVKTARGEGDSGLISTNMSIERVLKPTWNSAKSSDGTASSTVGHENGEQSSGSMSPIPSQNLHLERGRWERKLTLLSCIGKRVRENPRPKRNITDIEEKKAMQVQQQKYTDSEEWSDISAQSKNSVKPWLAGKKNELLFLVNQRLGNPPNCRMESWRERRVAHRDQL